MDIKVLLVKAGTYISYLAFSIKHILYLHYLFQTIDCKLKNGNVEQI